MIVPDNLKAAVIRAAFSVDGDAALNRSYRELARHFRFKVDPTPPYAPKKKGKVESGVKYVKRSALAGREGKDIAEVNRALQRWVEEVAGQRHHGTTGCKPLEAFVLEEQSELQSLPAARYEPVVWRKAKVHQDTHLHFDGRLYSVPWRWTGHDVWVQATASSVVVFADDTRIATHSRCTKGKRSTQEAHLPEHRSDRRHRSQAYWQQRADHVGPQTGALIREIFESDDVLYQLRKAQAVLTHLEGFPVKRAEAASRRALFYGNLTYRGVKTILANALDFEPLPAVVVDPPQSERPRFARNLSELIAQKLEVTNEPH